LGTAGFTEAGLPYPVTAKYHMNLINIPMELDSRSRKKSEFTNYQKDIVRQGVVTDKAFAEMLKI